MAALIPVTLVTFDSLQRYAPDGADRLRNPTFESELEGWRVNRGSGSVNARDGGVRLRNEDPDGFVGIRQVVALDDRPDALEFGAEISTEAIRAGSDPSHVGRVYLVLGGPGDDRYHVLAEVSGTRPWARHVSIVPLDDGIESVSLNIQLRRSVGALEVRRPSLVPLVERPGFAVARAVLLACWAALLAWIAAQFVRRAPAGAPRWLLPLAGLVLVIGAVVPDSARRVVLQVESVDRAVVEYAFHFTLFALLAALAIRSEPQRPASPQILWFAVLAAGTEALQVTSAGREPSVVDWVVDMAGVGVAHGWVAVRRLASPPARGDR